MIDVHEQSIELKKLLEHLIAASGKTPYRISKDINRPTNYISSLLARKTVPGLGVMADIAEACGYAIAIIGKDDAFGIMSYEFDSPSDKIDPWTDKEMDESSLRPWAHVMDELEASGKTTIAVLAPAKWESND